MFLKTFTTLHVLVKLLGNVRFKRYIPCLVLNRSVASVSAEPSKGLLLLLLLFPSSVISHHNSAAKFRQVQKQITVEIINQGRPNWNAFDGRPLLHLDNA